MEQTAQRTAGTGLFGGDFTNAILEVIETPIGLFNCPTRRNGGPYPYSGATYYSGDDHLQKMSISGSQLIARADYACCVGSGNEDENFGGLGGGDGLELINPTTGLPGNPPPPTNCTGIIFQASKTRVGDVTRGTSHTFLIGEKYLNPDNYYTGIDPSDNEGMYNGEDNDNSRDTGSGTPLQDKNGYQNTQIFGSAHGAGLNMLIADGSVQFIVYSVDPTLWLPAGHKNLDPTFVADPW
jgi:Protein of unknown function (DUF1559)